MCRCDDNNGTEPTKAFVIVSLKQIHMIPVAVVERSRRPLPLTISLLSILLVLISTTSLYYQRTIVISQQQFKWIKQHVLSSSFPDQPTVNAKWNPKKEISDNQTKPFNNKSNNNNNTKDQNNAYLSKSDYIYKRGSWDGAPVVVEKYQLIFFTVPKVGCTVFKQLFRRMANLKDWPTSASGKPHNPKVNGLTYLYNYNVNNATAMLTSNHWTKAIFVRDPKERLLSAYLDKAVHKQGSYMTHHCCPSCGTDSATLVGFLGVMQTCTDPHWMPQSKRMESRFWDSINFVGHIETAASDAKALLQRLGAWEEYGSSGWGHLGEESIFQSLSNVKHKTQANKHLLEYFDREAENLADKYYMEDYSFDKLGFVPQRIVTY